MPRWRSRERRAPRREKVAHGVGDRERLAHHMAAREVESLAEEFLERKRRGEDPTIAEYIARYPHLADEIREVFPVLGLVEDFKPGSGDMTPHGTPSGAGIELNAVTTGGGACK